MSLQLVLVLTGTRTLFSLPATLLSLSASFLLASWGISVPTYPGMHRCKPINKARLCLCTWSAGSPGNLHSPEPFAVTGGLAARPTHLFSPGMFLTEKLKHHFCPASRGTAGTPVSLKLLTHRSAVFSAHQLLSHADSHVPTYFRRLNLLSAWEQASYSYRFNSKPNFLHVAHLSENSGICKINFYIAGG